MKTEEEIYNDFCVEFDFWETEKKFHKKEIMNMFIYKRYEFSIRLKELKDTIINEIKNLFFRKKK